MSEVIVRHEDLRAFTESILNAAGLEPEAAVVTADCLVFANLRGVDSHGVQLLTFYMDHFLDGNMQVTGRGRVLSESGCCLLYDGENCVGQAVSAAASDHAVRLAEAHGVGLVSVRRSNHFGAAAYWARRMSARGMIGIALCNASPSVAPWQGRDKRVGTNPICMSVPGENARPWLLDMATTTVAMGKIFKAKLAGKSTIPAGWAMDAEGVPTTDVGTALAGLLMPLGGYKGSGLAMLVEILSGVLSGGAIATEVGGVYIHSRPMGTSHLFLAIDVSRLMPLDEFRQRMDRLVASVKSSQPAAGYDEVLVAGDPEWRLAMLVEILSGVLSGGAMATEVGGVYIHSRPMGTSHFFLAIDVSRLMPLGEFRQRMHRLVSSVKSSQPAAGYDEVLVAGDPEWRLEDERRRAGIALDTGVWRKLVETAARVGVSPPPVL